MLKIVCSSPHFAGLMHSTLCTVIVVNHCKEAKLVSFMYFEGLEHVHVHVYYVAMVMAVVRIHVHVHLFMVYIV